MLIDNGIGQPYRELRAAELVRGRQGLCIILHTGRDRAAFGLYGGLRAKEKAPAAYRGFDEQDYRQYFIPAFASVLPRLPTR